MKDLEILDTSLRDGVQGHNISYSLQDKLQIVSLLKKLGIHLIEGGNPSANPLDRQLFDRLNDPDVVAFGSTRRKDLPAKDDIGLRTLKELNASVITIFGKSSTAHVENILHCTKQENLDMISSSVQFLTDSGKRVIFDAEHFFDGYALDPSYAMATLKAAAQAGADTLVLCDTNGGTFPDRVRDIVIQVKSTFPTKKIGIHTHNDCGLAVACTMAAVEGGAQHIQGTLLGTGERCGNACLSTIIPNLQLKCGYNLIAQDNLKLLTPISRHLAEITNIALNPQLPYIGDNAFTHKAGMHCDGIIKSSKSFEQVSPDEVGNGRKLLVSLLSGKASIIEKLKELFPNEKLSTQTVEGLLNSLKQKEYEGYTYEGAEASLKILIKSLLNKESAYFDLINYKVITDETGNNAAMVKLKVSGEERLACGEGLGPVHAMDIALRKALSAFYPSLSKVTLSDYKVRVLDSKSATGAKVRVLVTSSDGKNSWSTVGVSADIIRASFTALTDSINYYLESTKES